MKKHLQEKAQDKAPQGRGVDSSPEIVMDLMALRNRLDDLEVGREVFDILGRYGIVARYRRTVGDSHVLLGVIEKRYPDCHERDG